MANSAKVDTGLLAKLLAYTPLTSIASDGIFWGIGQAGATRFVVVDLLDHHDEDVFGGRAIESSLYLVKYVERQDSAGGYSNIRAAQAADMIDTALAEQPLVAAGYTWMSCSREERVRILETDPDDPSVRWVHWGGHYRVEMSVVGM
jgi:hypothetical protein